MLIIPHFKLTFLKILKGFPVGISRQCFLRTSLEFCSTQNPTQDFHFPKWLSPRTDLNMNRIFNHYLTPSSHPLLSLCTTPLSPPPPPPPPPHLFPSVASVAWYPLFCIQWETSKKNYFGGMILTYYL